MEETREGEAQREGSHLREAVGALRAVSHLLPPGRRVELLQIAADSLTAIRGNLEEIVRARDRLEEALMECGPWLQHTLLADPGSLDEANRLIGLFLIHVDDVLYTCRRTTPSSSSS